MFICPKCKDTGLYTVLSSSERTCEYCKGRGENPLGPIDGPNICYHCNGCGTIITEPRETTKICDCQSGMIHRVKWEMHDKEFRMREAKAFKVRITLFVGGLVLLIMFVILRDIYTISGYELEKIGFMKKSYTDRWNRTENYWYWEKNNGRLIDNRFTEISSSQGMIVFDRIDSLYWQRQGSANEMTYDDAKIFIKKLNQSRFAGFNDWRLPHIREILVLFKSVDRRKSNRRSNMLVPDKFSLRGNVIWTADKHAITEVWCVDFYSGYFQPQYTEKKAYVLAVR